MGKYLNPEPAAFEDALLSRNYVDKTMMIAQINSFIDERKKYICISRPRRFGKTIAGNMLAAYYEKGRDTAKFFDGLKIEKDPSFEKYLGQFQVIKIDLNGEYITSEDEDDLLRRLQTRVAEELAEAFPQAKVRSDEALADNLFKVYDKTGEKFVIIIDEYDTLVRNQVSPKLLKRYLGFLEGLFKNDTIRPAIALAYLTGILPVVREKIQSKLNNFQEYTILDAAELAEFVGFTDEEVRALCEKENMDYEECRRWYDGYRQQGYEIYNPESVILSIKRRRFGSYWSQTSSYQVIEDRLKANFDGMKDAVIRLLSGESIDIDVHYYLNTMTDFKNQDDAFTYLLHLGYLVYDINTQTCRIPNMEIRQEWTRAVHNDENQKETDRIIKESKELLYATIRGDEKAVAHALDSSHMHVTSNRSYNNEDALGSAIYLAYIYAINDYTIVREMTAGRGFADIVYIPTKPEDAAMIIELKRNKTAESAIDQIREKKYFDCLKKYKGKLLFVGVNYDENTKEHTCRIEEFEKDMI